MMCSKKLFSFFLFALATFSLSAKDIFVSPSGNDSNDGTKKLPLRTITSAQQLALNLLETGEESEITVWLSNGTYSISAPLVFKSLNSKGKNVSLVFKAQKGDSPVISGGVEITGWTKNADGIWEVDLPGVLEGESGFRELFIEGKRAIRARFPNEGFLHVEKAGEDRRTNFFFGKDDFPIPGKVEGLELVFLHDWSISRIGVKEIDSTKSQLFTVDSIGARSPDFFHIDYWEPNPRYFLENAPEFLDAAYEWIYLDDLKKIQLKLPENINPNELQIAVPLSEGLITILGEKNLLVKNLHFEGITFQFSKWEIPEKGYCGIQACHHDPRPAKGAWAVVPSAISAVWAENVSFVRCTFRNFGGSGIWFGTGSKNCKVLDSELADISGNGIMIGEGQDREVDGQPWWTSAPEQVAVGNTIQNTTVTQVGTQFYGAVGIWGGLTAETRIENNHIFDLPYTGISVGWMWSPVATPSRQNIISGNHIHDIMNILSDGGGIYMLGLQPGSKILNNRIYDVEVNAGRAESNGMFLDEGITDVLVEGNLVYNIAKSPLRFHRATVNLVRNNSFFCQGGNPPIRYNTTKEEDIQKVGNRVFNVGDTEYEQELNRAIGNWEKQAR